MKHFYSLILLLLLGSTAIAQSTVTGKVTDTKGESLPGVSVSLKGTSTGVISDADGGYSISAPADGTLVFSFIGFKAIEIAIGGRSIINTQLEEDVTSLDEVVVIGYGVQKKSVATASISKVDAKQLEGFSVARVDRMLQGQVSGAIIKPNSNQPGAGLSIILRGPGTHMDTSPLIVVDGMTANDGVLASLNPSDIESIQILKDGASTAIYGARSANGIIMVTTKKAKNGEARISYSGYYGMQQVWKEPEVLNAKEYVTLIREKYANGGSTLPSTFPTEDNIPTNSNWIGKVFEPSSTQTHNLSINKGTENGTLYAALSYFDQRGVIAPSKSNARRISTRINTEQKINNVFAFGENLYFQHSTNETIGDNNIFGSPLSEAFVYDPITPFYDENGTFGYAQSPYVQKEYMSPLSQIFITNTSTNQNSLLGNVFFKISPIKGLTFKTDVGVDYNAYSGNGFTPSYHLFDTNGNQLTLMNEMNDINEYTTKVFIWQWENYATYTRSFGKHNGEVTVGTTFRERNENGFGANSSGIPEESQFDPAFQVINATPDSLRRSSSYNGVRDALASFFGRVIYNYDERYLLTLTVRRDGSTKFGENYRYGTFPSISAGWIVSKESFWNFEAINFFKFRASYGVNGSDRIPSLGYRSLIAVTGAYPFGKPGTPIINNGQSLTKLDNPNLRWEESHQLDIGIELGLLNDQLTLEMDFYNKTTSGLLMQETVPDYVGNNPGDGNVGEIVNRGIEVEANYKTTFFNNIKFGVGLNVTTLRNRVTKVTGNGYIEGYTLPIRNFNLTRMEVGHPVGYFRGYQTNGIFNSEDEVFSYINSEGNLIQPDAEAGDIRFVDVNKDGVIDANDITQIGNPWPSVMLGLNLSIGYKGFDIRALFTSSLGFEIYRAYERQDVPLNNYSREWLGRWTESNPDASYPRLTTNDLNNNSRASDFYLEDGSFVRLKNLQIGYTVPGSLLKRVGFQSLRIYSSFDNLWTITGYSGFDPEIGGGILNNSIDQGFYPQMKTVGVGLNLTF